MFDLTLHPFTDMDAAHVRDLMDAANARYGVFAGGCLPTTPRKEVYLDSDVTMFVGSYLIERYEEDIPNVAHAKRTRMAHRLIRFHDATSTQDPYADPVEVLVADGIPNLFDAVVYMVQDAMLPDIQNHLSKGEYA